MREEKREEEESVCSSQAFRMNIDHVIVLLQIMYDERNSKKNSRKGWNRIVKSLNKVLSTNYTEDMALYAYYKQYALYKQYLKFEVYCGISIVDLSNAAWAHVLPKAWDVLHLLRSRPPILEIWTKLFSLHPLPTMNSYEVDKVGEIELLCWHPYQAKPRSLTFGNSSRNSQTVDLDLYSHPGTSMGRSDSQKKNKKSTGSNGDVFCYLYKFTTGLEVKSIRFLALDCVAQQGLHKFVEGLKHEELLEWLIYKVEEWRKEKRLRKSEVSLFDAWAEEKKISFF